MIYWCLNWIQIAKVRFFGFFFKKIKFIDQNTNFTIKVEQMEKQNRKLEVKKEVF